MALDAAHQNLRLYTCKHALVAGVCLQLHASSFGAFCALHALSPDGQCKTFDDLANGYGRSEAFGAVVLEVEHLESEVQLGGTAVNQDDYSSCATQYVTSTQNLCGGSNLHEHQMQPDHC